MPALVSVNPLKVLLWTYRRNPSDIVDLYDTLSPVMRLATGGDMLNFGYWCDGGMDPASAQNTLCSLVGDVAELRSATRLIDVGSGLAAPAGKWTSIHPSLDVFCVNINRKQLQSASRSASNVPRERISQVNATSVAMPFSDHSADRIVALESAQHFRPLDEFVRECRRVLKPGGLLVMAMPVIASALKRLESLLRLGILSFTWSSERYSLDFVRSAIAANGFRVREARRIGHQVYEPLAEYYLQNRSVIRERILREYPSFLESILCRSLARMRQASEEGIIDYVIIVAS